MDGGALMKRTFVLLLVVGAILLGCSSQQSANTLVVGTAADFPPLEFIDEMVTLLALILS